MKIRLGSVVVVTGAGAVALALLLMRESRPSDVGASGSNVDSRIDNALGESETGGPAREESRSTPIVAPEPVAVKDTNGDGAAPHDDPMVEELRGAIEETVYEQ